ncbi:MAG: isoaspartyl peptidase/L-asparaginase family protein [Sphingomonadaceae bacterium]
MTDSWTLLLHGGAGVNPTRDYAEVERHLADVATGGGARLAAGAAALDVVEWAVAQLEASGLYVAGRGSAPNRDGVHEFDAAIMDGARHRAGAVCAVRDIRSPIAAARAVLERSPHVLLAGEGARAFALAHGVEPIGTDPNFFRLPVGVEAADIAEETRSLHGTVGAVARDGAGRLAAATSTGGTFGKLPGRVGDTPLIGAGTWADTDIAISCTGVGEAFILAGGAGDVAARVRYARQAPKAAADAMLARVRALGGDGGLIAVMADGTPIAAWNSPGLKRAIVGSHHCLEIGIV